jgi:hypothetical protein
MGAHTSIQKCFLKTCISSVRRKFENSYLGSDKSRPDLATLIRQHEKLEQKKFFVHPSGEIINPNPHGCGI